MRKDNFGIDRNYCKDVPFDFMLLVVHFDSTAGEYFNPLLLTVRLVNC